MPFLLLAWVWLSNFSPPYVAVVVDARTNRPLVGVNVRSAEGATRVTNLVTDNAGRFSLAAAPVSLQLTMLGYASLKVGSSATVPLQPDTLRMLPQALVLGEVAVRPGKMSVLSTISAKGSHLARQLVPGQSIAMLLLPPASAPVGQACVLDQIRLFLLDKPRQGRLRVRLVNVVAASSPGATARPGTADLVPEAAIFTVFQMAAAHKQLTLDMSKYGLLLPAEGLCVIVECLPTKPTDQFVAVTHPTNGKGGIKVVLAPDPADRNKTAVFDEADFPALDGQQASGEVPTWAWSTTRPQWHQLSGIHPNVRVEAVVYTY